MDNNTTPTPRRTVPAPKFVPGETATLLQPNGVLILARISRAMWLPKHGTWKYNLGNSDTPVEEDQLAVPLVVSVSARRALDVTDLVDRSRNPAEKPYPFLPAPEPMDAAYPFNS